MKVDHRPNDLTVPSLGPKMECTKCDAGMALADLGCRACHFGDLSALAPLGITCVMVRLSRAK
jgi:hypothetical protein